MIQTQTLDKYSVFGENAIKAAPDAVKYASGFKQADVLPAEWLNWAWHKNSKCITDLNTGLTAVEEELNAVLTEDGKESDGSKGQIIASIKSIIKKAVDAIINGMVVLQKLTVAGNIIQKDNSKAYLLDVYIKNNIINLRDGISTALNNNDIAGFKAYKCNGEKDCIIGFDKSGTARAGNDNDTHPITLRSEDSEMENGSAVVWNSSKRQLETEKRLSIAVSQNIGKIDFNKTIAITASEQIILTIGKGEFIGLEVKIINSTDKTHIIRCTSASETDSTLLAGQIQTVIWNGSKWEGLSCPRIGEVYVQYPQQTSPTDLFVCTKWKLQEQYAGAFFRATGGNAAAFIEKTGNLIAQSDQNKNHNHGGTTGDMSKNKQGAFTVSNGANVDSPSGFVSLSGSGTGYSSFHEGFARVSMDITHTHSIATDGGGESRPINYTICLWSRIA